MRVLFAHNFYQQRGGEESVLEAEMALLQQRGHDVRLVSASNDDLVGIRDKLRVMAHVATNSAAEERLGRELRDFKPDVLHVHNFFPQLTPSVYWAAARAGVPTVQSLHNFRPMCAGAFLFRDGRICERCIGGSPWTGALHRCYRGSFAGSLALAHMIATHRRRRTWSTMVRRYIVPSAFVGGKFVEAGFPADRIVLKPHFIADPGAPPASAPRSGALFVGRLSAEKGIGRLIDTWRGIDMPLRVAGGGPLESELRSAAPQNVTFLGQIPRDRIRGEMERASVLVVPSEWHEVFGMVVVEAFAAGLPVLAARSGALPELVQDGATGRIFEPGDTASLQRAVAWARDNAADLARMGEEARKLYERSYAPDANYPLLMAIYDAAVAAGPSEVP